MNGETKRNLLVKNDGDLEDYKELLSLSLKEELLSLGVEFSFTDKKNCGIIDLDIKNLDFLGNNLLIDKLSKGEELDPVLSKEFYNIISEIKYRDFFGMGICAINLEEYGYPIYIHTNFDKVVA